MKFFSKQNLYKYREQLLVLLFVQATLAMFGSLYYSNFGDPVVNFQRGLIFNPDGGLVPCTLCWFARILMFPLTWISLIGILRKDYKVVWYILPASIVGVGLEVYHYVLQKFNFETVFDCTSANPCSALKVDYFGFITIPFLCLIAFVVITTLGLLIARGNMHESNRISKKEAKNTLEKTNVPATKNTESNEKENTKAKSKKTKKENKKRKKKK